MSDFDDKDSLQYNPRNDFFDDEFWNSLIATWPDFFENLGYWWEDVMIECNAWSYIVRHRPEWAIHMKRDDWTRFDENDWMRLLDPYWNFLAKGTVVLDDWFWWNCLSRAPRLAELCERNGGWCKLSNNHMVDLMIKYSELTRIGVKYLNWDALSDTDWMRLINTQPQFASKYIETHSSDEIGKRTEAEIIEKAKEFITREERMRLARPPSHDYNDYADWREASGWNDVYGSDVEASDIIEFRD